MAQDYTDTDSAGGAEGTGNKLTVAAGLALIVIGLTANLWILAALLSPDGTIESTGYRAAILAFEVICVVAGGALIGLRSRIRLRKRHIAVAAGVAVLMIVSAEAALRVFYHFLPRHRSSDEVLGWRTLPDQKRRRTVPGYGDVGFSTTRDGFRVFGDPDTDKTKILVLGDSYTMAYTVSDGDTYYDYLQKNNRNVEVFAYGCGGYGTLQEYMVLDRHFDEIKPDVVLWQFAPNDVINNDFDLERRSASNNNYMRRPYYADGRIEYRFPSGLSPWLVRPVESSFILRLVYIRASKSWLARRSAVEKELTADHPLLRRSLKTTSAVLKLARDRALGNVIVAFCTQPLRWKPGAYREVCEGLGIRYVDSVSRAVKEAKRAGVAVDGAPRDPHWNAAGHAIAGKAILDYLVENGLVPADGQ